MAIINSIFTGVDTSDSNAQDKDILENRVAYVDGNRVVGTMPNRGSISKTLNCGENYTIPKGYHDGSGKVIANPLSDQTVATAEPNNIFIGKTAWVNGNKITGTMVDNGAVTASLNADETYTIPEGYHNGSGIIITNPAENQTPGDAKANDILVGKVAWINGNKITGTMANRGAISQAINAGDNYVIPEGYHNGSGKVIVELAEDQINCNATADNILEGKTACINGTKVTGTMINQEPITKSLNCDEIYTIPKGYHDGTGKVTANSLASQTSATATPENILEGKTAWINGSQLTGIMPNKGAVTQALNTGENYTIPKGYHNGSGKVTVNVPESQRGGTAIASDILEGKTAYVEGLKITGTIPDNGAKNVSLNAGGSYTIPEGYHNGLGVITANSLESQTSATAVPSKILSGKTAWVNGDKITGTMINNGSVTQTLNVGESYTIPTGYHDGSGKITAKLPDDQMGCTAIASDILSGETACVDGVKITGTMVNRGSVTQTLNSGESYTIPEGYHSGFGVITANSFANQTSATATPSKILYGETAYVNGNKITGTMPNQGAFTQSLNCGQSCTIPEGYHNGSGVITANVPPDQSGGTATASDILKGKTAFVNGVKITGTLNLVAAGTDEYGNQLYRKTS